MESIVRFTAVCIVGAVLALFVKKNSPDMGLLISLAVCAVLMAALLRPLEQALGLVREMIAWSGMQEEIFGPLLKILGISLICRVGGDLCRDAGQNAMGSMVEMVGAFGAILVSMPLLRAVWEMLQSLL